jgi:hypothetical protein
VNPLFNSAIACTRRRSSCSGLPEGRMSPYSPESRPSANSQQF